MDLELTILMLLGFQSSFTVLSTSRCFISSVLYVRIIYNFSRIKPKNPKKKKLIKIINDRAYFKDPIDRDVGIHIKGLFYSSEIMYVMVRMNSLWFFQSKKSINRNNNSQRETNANPTSYQKIPPSATYLIFQNYNINF